MKSRCGNEAEDTSKIICAGFGTEATGDLLLDSGATNRSFSGKLIPGPRDEEKIDLIRTMKATLDEDEWISFIDGLANDYSNFDAMYYACENGDEMLEDRKRHIFPRCDSGHQM